MLEFAPIFGCIKACCKLVSRLAAFSFMIRKNICPGGRRWLGIGWRWTLLLLVTVGPLAAAQQVRVPSPKIAQPGLELSRAVRAWEFISAVGRRAGLFGNEAGTVEAWVYPLKILRDFQLVFHVGGRSIPAGALARTITARPEAVTIAYASDTFAVQETFFVPWDEAGAVIALEITSHQPIEIEA